MHNVVQNFWVENTDDIVVGCLSADEYLFVLIHQGY